MNSKQAKDFIKALDALVAEKGIDKKIVIEAMEQAMAAAYKKNEGVSNVEASVDAETGDIKLPETEHPVYLSIDKDVISRDELVTNWDQGQARWEDVTSFTRRILSDRKVIGVDICGECAPDQEDCDVALETEGNDEFNKDILEYIYM